LTPNKNTPGQILILLSLEALC